MGKLNIAHHKSYHPYRADNIERVRRDEEEARLKEAIEDGRVSLADSEARIALLRDRAKAESKPSKHKQQREEEKLLQSKNPLIDDSASEHHVTKDKGEGGALTLTAASGHVNFFEELEYSHQNTLEHSGRAKTKAEIDKAREKELERGVPLMPDEKDRRPWYMDKGLKHPKDMTDEEIKSKEQTEPETEREKWGKRSRGIKTSSKTTLDPLKDMQSHLAARSRALSSRSSNPVPPPPAPPRASTSSGPKDAATERATREAAERARAEALIAKRRAEMDATSSVGGDTPHSVRDGGYSDVYNKRETREAHHAWERQRGRYSDRGWDEERDSRDRDRERRDRSRESRRSESRGSRRDDYDERDRRRDRERDGDRDRDRHRDLPRGERNRTRGVDDIRRRN
ncbi:unnamed protein product [Rhizoctonia solani]|uniref:CBF1-interacting co-repressor CIR N-terminal domain-containing protein n=1 Tax=Rhizoctonia solani TaxID=456999 RepID=A0A8H3CC35_9AGAM|nr:unnamed protein product [Rhizoctonia solani]CAE6479205.1 unnamed protein product [Rhizoctonia solani]